VTRSGEGAWKSGVAGSTTIWSITIMIKLLYP
jgi:hypothetical protein